MSGALSEFPFALFTDRNHVDLLRVPSFIVTTETLVNVDGVVSHE